MKLQAETSGRKHDIEIKRKGEKVFAEIDGRKYELEASSPEPDVYLFKHEGRVFEVFVSSQANAADPKLVRVGNDVHEVRIIDPKRLRGTGTDDEHSDGLAEIKTAMPGKVVRILLELGAEVEKGTGVLVVEAMKMQNELKSPKNGVIKDIRVEEGSTVAAGDVLATIE